MKKLMQMLLASFGVLALMLAGCETTDDTMEDGDMMEDDGEMMEEGEMEESGEMMEDAE